MHLEQSLLLAIRHQLSVFGYSESVIDSQESEITNFCESLIQSADHEMRRDKLNIDADIPKYKYYMYINNPVDMPFPTWQDPNDPKASAWFNDYRFGKRGIIFDTFESDQDWDRALRSRDVATLTAIYDEVVKFAKTTPVPSDVVRFIEDTPKNIANEDWESLKWNHIVDAYCDYDEDEYVIYNG